MFISSLMLLLGSPTGTWRISLDDLEVYVTDPFTTNLIAVADDGTLVIKDSNNSRLLFLDADGVLHKTFGQKGMGPGEFFSIDGLTWVGEKQAFFVTDRGTQRLSQFDRQGNLMHAEKAGFFRDPVLDRHGKVYFMKRVGSNSDYRNAIYTYTPQSKAEKEIFSSAMELIATHMIWHPRLVFAPGSNFVAVNLSSNDAIQILDPETGARLANWDAHLPEIPLTKGFREAYMKDFLSRVFAKGAPPKGFQVDHREVWPFLHTMLVDAQDRIWVFLFRSDVSMPVPYRMFDRTGTLLAKGKVTGMPQTIALGNLYALEVRQEETILTRTPLTTLLP